MRIDHVLIGMMFVSGAISATAGELTHDEFLKLHAELQPDDSALWRSVKWKTSVLSAQQIAAEQKEPKLSQHSSRSMAIRSRGTWS